MKKVCHITSAHSRFDTRIFIKQCKSLVGSGYNVTLLCADGLPNETNNGIDIVSVKKAANKIERLFLSSTRLLKKALEIDADIYQIHDPELLLLGLQLKKKGKKVVFDSHENWERYMEEIGWVPSIVSKQMSRVLSFFYRKNLYKYDAVFTVSPNIVDELRKYTKNVFSLINYPVIKKNDSNYSLEEYSTREKSLCYVGTVYKNSNQENIIQVISSIPNVSYTVIGYFDAGYFKHLSESYNFTKLTLIQAVSQEKLLKEILQNTIGLAILDYHKNTGGKIGSMGVNKIYDYMLAGIPVICSDVTLWKEFIIDKYNCGICVEPGNNKAIKDAILYLTTHIEEAYQMGQNGRNVVLKEFNWATQEKELLRVYNLLLK